MAYLARKTLSTLVVCALMMSAAACGAGSVPSAPSPSPAPAPGPAPAPAPTNVVTITANGPSPASITVAVGTRVTFVNNDVIAHDVAGGPDPAHPDCPEIDAAGFMSPGQSKQTAPLLQARTCDYHDHSFHSSLYTGRIVIR